MRKLKALVLPAIIVSTALIRLVSINQSLWLDEATTALAAKMSLRELFLNFLPGDFHPPFYYFLMHFWVGIFGSSEVSLRIPSVLAGVAAIYIIFLIGKKIGSSRLGLLASIFLASSGLHIYYSQEARMYGLATMLVSLSVLLFLQESWWWFSVILALIGMTDYVSLLIIPALWLLSYLEKKNRVWRKKFLLAHVPLIVFFGLWMPTFLGQLRNGINVSVSAPGWWQILGQVTIKNIVLIPVKFIIGRVSIDNKVLYAAVLGVVAGVFLYLILRAKSKLLIWLWLVVPTLLGIVLSLFIPTLTYFRYLFILPAFYLLLAEGTLSLKKRQFWTLAVFVLLVNLISSFTYLLIPRFWREDWRSLVAFVESKKTKNSVTIFVSDSNMEAYRYYSPDARIAGPGGVRAGYDQVWLMRYVKEVFDKKDGVRGSIEGLGYAKSGEFDFNGVIVWQYLKKNSYADRN